MKILTQTEARAVKAAIEAIDAIGTPVFSIALGEGGATATIKVDEGMITVQNATMRERYGDVGGLAFMYSL